MTETTAIKPMESIGEANAGVSRKRLYLEDFFYTYKRTQIEEENRKKLERKSEENSEDDDGNGCYSSEEEEEDDEEDEDYVEEKASAAAGGSKAAGMGGAESKEGLEMFGMNSTGLPPLPRKPRKRGNYDDSERKYHCTQCDFKSKYTKSLKEHVLLHKSKEEVKMYKCPHPTCQYETRRKNYLRKHNLIHKTDETMEMHKCPHCDFLTKRKDGLQRHILLLHDNSDEAMFYKCPDCDYQTKLSYSLTSHMLVHKTSDDFYKYECTDCPYKTKEKKCLLKHLKCHKSKDEIETFKCEHCPFESRRKSGLEKHLVPIFGDGTDLKCNVCPFETKYKKCMRAHMILVHRSIDKMYKCPYCCYQHSKKKKLTRHLSVHSESDEVYKYRCGECPFKTKWVDALNTHRLRHVKEEGVKKGFRCLVCSYNARNKAHHTRHMKIHKKN